MNWISKTFSRHLICYMKFFQHSLPNDRGGGLTGHFWNWAIGTLHQKLGHIPRVLALQKINVGEKRPPPLQNNLGSGIGSKKKYLFFCTFWSKRSKILFFKYKCAHFDQLGQCAHFQMDHFPKSKTYSKQDLKWEGPYFYYTKNS